MFVVQEQQTQTHKHYNVMVEWIEATLLEEWMQIIVLAAKAIKNVEK